MGNRFKTGDPVIYRKQKFSLRPGPQAVNVSPAPGGDEYSYCVDKFWRVVEVLPDGMVQVCTRRGKRLVVAQDDPALRPASWWERLFRRRLFPPLASPEQSLSPR